MHSARGVSGGARVATPSSQAYRAERPRSGILVQAGRSAVQPQLPVAALSRYSPGPSTPRRVEVTPPPGPKPPPESRRPQTARDRPSPAPQDMRRDNRRSTTLNNSLDIGYIRAGLKFLERVFDELVQDRAICTKDIKLLHTKLENVQKVHEHILKLVNGCPQPVEEELCELRKVTDNLARRLDALQDSVPRIIGQSMESVLGPREFSFEGRISQLEQAVVQAGQAVEDIREYLAATYRAAPSPESEQDAGPHLRSQHFGTSSGSSSRSPGSTASSTTVGSDRSIGGSSSPAEIMDVLTEPASARYHFSAWM